MCTSILSVQLPCPKWVGNSLQGPKGVCNGSIVHTNIDEDEVGHREAALSCGTGNLPKDN